MSRYIAMLFIMALCAMGASAQTAKERIRKHRIEQRLSKGQLTAPERFRIRKDQFRYRLAERKVRRDGIITPLERRKLQKIKRHNRVQFYRFRHNDRRRVI